MPPPRFSVVVPAYNATRTIDATLLSILAQSERDLELIVVDDGSSDATAQHVRAHAKADSRVHLIEQANQGVAGARNTGIAASSGEYVSFLDNDDLWLRDYLANMQSALRSAPQAGFAYTDAWLWDDSVARIRKLTSLEHYPSVPPGLDPEALYVRLIEANFIMSSVTIRSRVLEEVGGFDQALSGPDDWDLWLRIVARGYTAVQAPGCSLVQRDRIDSQSKDESMMLERMIPLLSRVRDADSTPVSVRDAAAKRIEAVNARLLKTRRQGPITGPARRVVRAVRGYRERKLWRKAWRAEPPDVIALELPGLVASYGEAETSSS